MSSFSDLVKKANTSTSTYKKTGVQEEEKKKTSSFGDLVKKAYDGTYTNTSLTGDEVSSWINGIYGLSERAYKYLSADGYKTPDANLRKEIDTYLSNANNVAQYVRANKTNYKNYDEVYNGLYEQINALRRMQSSLNESDAYYSAFGSEDVYFWSAAENREKRQQRYTDNQQKIEGLKTERNQSTTTRQRKSEIDAEIATIETEMRNYERGNDYFASKTVDDYYLNYTGKTDFGGVSANRSFTNPTTDALQRDDIMKDSSQWYWGADGKQYDAFGNEVVKGYDSKGNAIWVSSGLSGSKITDRLGFYLNASETDLDDAAATDVNHEGTATSVLKDGIHGNWELLNDTEVSIYYYILNSDGQAAADKYLDSMTTELNKRATKNSVAHLASTYENANWAERAVLNVATVGAQLFSNIAGGIDFAGSVITGKELNPYSMAYAGKHFSDTVRGETAKNWDEATGGAEIPIIGFSAGDLYQTGMSLLDSYAAMGIGGSLGGVLLGMGAGASEAVRLYEEGASDAQIAWGGMLAGAAEMVFETVSIGELKAIKNAADVNRIIKHALIQGGVEASEEGFTEIANIITNAIVMGSESEWAKLIEENDGNVLKAVLKKLQEVAAASFGGFLSGFAGGGGVASVYGIENNIAEAEAAKNLYGENSTALIDEALEIDPKNKFAQKMQTRAADGKDISGSQLAKLVRQNEAGMVKNDTAAIKEAAKQRLADLGETSNIEAVSSALAKQAAGEKLTKAEQQTISNSKYGQRVANELDTENIKSGNFSSEWAQQIDTDRINADEYSSLVKAAQIEQTADNPITNTANEPQEATSKEPLQVEDEAAPPDNANTQAPVNVLADNVIDEDQPEKSSITLESASKAYGAQAGAYVATYNLASGQDIAKFDDAYRKAYEWGQSDAVPLDVAMNSSLTSYLTEAQREAAYMAGADAKNALTSKRVGAVNQRRNGKSGRRKGTVQGKGVSIADLKKTFNDKQGKAYKILVQIAEVTGIDIVLYRSEANTEGEFTEDQGQFKWSDDKIYIDINAGLESIKDVNDLAKYTMLRTFGHEFIHFLEKHNPAEYNELRKAMFDALRERGENVDALILEKQQLGGKNKDGSYKLSYEAASREEVAEGLADILPESHFAEQLAEKHKNLFETLIAKLKEFIASIREYFESINPTMDKAAQALKEEVDGTVRYMESIVALFDKVAVNAVENYQASVAIDEAATVSETKAEAKTDITEAEIKTEDDGSEFTITDNAEYGSLEIKFDGKPSEAVRDVLKANKFRWHKQKQIWYGKAERVDIVQALRAAYEQENADITPEATEATPEPVQEVVAEGDPANNIVEEENESGENVDNRETVPQSTSDGQGDAQLLDEVEAGDVQGDGSGRDAVADIGERGQQTGRYDNRPDAERTGGRSSERDSESGDLRRDNGLTDEETAPEESAKAQKKLHEAVVEQISQQSTEKPKGRNFVIGESLDLPNGEKARYKANIEAIKLVKKLEAEGRYATEAEQAILSKYVGWGGLANAFDERKAEWSKEFNELKELLTDEEYKLARGSTLNAHYTDISVIKAMYDGLSQLGFNGGRLLEPSSGVGNFVGAMPTEMSSKVKSWTMVELDGITGLIAKYLYPNADVRIQGFEKANIPNNYMDVAISNVPFGNYPITDKAYPKAVTSAIHNYFFAKSLDKVRPGGIVMFITSSYTMNSKDNAVRRYIMQRADLLGAIRLPDTAFKGNAGTEVVTDILILKKRADNTSYAGMNFLEAPYQYIEGYRGANINNYFVEHPEMVLGTATMSGSMYRGDSLTYKAFTDRGSLAEQIREAFSHIEGKMDYPAQLSPEKTNFAVERASKKTKEGGYVAKDGKIYKNNNGNLVEQSVSTKEAERIAGMLGIRDAARDLQNGLQQGLNDTEIRKARQKLNKAYDAFVKKHGYINARANKAAITGDPDKFSILALENWNSEEKTATKADIFSKNTIAPNRTITSAKDVAEGLIVSVNQTGGVDVPLIAALTSKSVPDVTRELIDSRLVFKNRHGDLETAESYLSGNVRAKLRDAEALVPLDEDYAKNVEALKSVMPEDVGYQDIFVNPGTPWIPNSVYSDFAAHMLGTRNTDWNKAVDITRNPETGNFTVELKNKYLKSNAYNTQKWGTNRRTFLDLFDAMLNSRSVVVKYKTDDGTTVVDKDATAAANEKIENITKEFQDWLWQDEARRTELETLYNEVFNSVVTPKYNGDNLTVNGANAMKPLRPHQRNAVQRIIASGGNTLLAHKVGAGKTYEMAAAAMKLKQLGLVHKPLFAVPKSLVSQWGTEFMDFFPTARLLVSEETDFTTANRKTFMNRIANGNYDAVIVSYEQFEKLPMSDEFTVAMYEKEISAIITAIEMAKMEKKDSKSLSVKDLEKKRKSLQAKIDKLTSKPKDEGNINFEELGVDGLFIDEAHNFKNLFYTTSMTNVSGLGNKDGSGRAFDLYTKVRYLQQLNGGRGIVFATATPVMNSMSEMYIMQKYLQPDLLDQLGLTSFDAWAKQFGEVVNGVEIKPSGQGYRIKQSFSRFKNMSELQLLFRNFADVLTDIPGLKIPKMKGGKVQVVVCEPGQYQQDYMKELEKRADNIKNVDPSEDNMLKITSDGRKISYTQRMIDPSLPYEEGCKIFRCADNVAQEYKDSKGIKGTQLIFCDMATPKGKSKTAAAETVDAEMDMESAQLYDDIKSRLIENGIPAKEIAFIHDADTDQKKKKLFADVNEGKIRVLIGSTGKMGVGMNAQKRVVAIHHLDAPWRPGDVEQRNGRAFRQGNINDEVSCYTYVTEGSFDARLWDILERKQNFINQVMNGENVGRETEDTGEVTLSAAEVKALASGSPLIMEQVQLDTDIKKLESLRRAHTSAVRAAKERLETDKGTIATLEKRIAAGKADAAAIVDTYSEGKFSITVGNKKYTEKKDAGVALMAEATAKATDKGYITIGSFAGFDLRVVKTHEGIKGLISGKQGYSFNTYPGNTTFMINHLIATIEGISESVKAWENGLVETRKDMAEQEKLIAEPFAKQAELDQKRTRYNEVMEILNPKEEQALDSADEDIVQSQPRANRKNDTDEYPTSGVHWGIEDGIITEADARVVWEAIANINKRGFTSYQKTIRGESFISSNNILMVVDTDYRYPSIRTIYKFNASNETDMSYAKEWLIDARGIQSKLQEARTLIEIVYGEGHVNEYDIRYRTSDERKVRGGKGTDSGTNLDEDADRISRQSRGYLKAVDNAGNTLTAEQQEFFKDSKARDKDGNLLVLYHGTGKAGFTSFDTGKGRFGGNWFTTSRRDADTYAGNYQHKLFDPNETDEIRSSVGGNYTLGSWMRFDTEQDRADFLKQYPNAETIKTDAEYAELLKKADEAEDWDEYERLEDEQYESRKELKKLEKAYARYEWEHSRETTLQELFDHPERFSMSDVIRAWDAYDRNNSVGEDEATKEELIESLREIDREGIEQGDGTIANMPFKARLPIGETGEIVNRANNRTYAVYANAVNPYTINANMQTLHGANLYPVIEQGMKDPQYDSVIVRNARVGAHEDIGDVVIIKDGGQVKLTSNTTPTEGADIQSQPRTKTLSDHEVLEMAADEVLINDFTDAEKDAFNIFKKRLARLRQLQEQRAEQGSIYKEQQFGAKPNREEAAKTLNRMHILDDQIKQANDDLFTIEEKAVLRSVLKKARRVVEQDERAKSDEKLKRWRDRRNNATAIKKYRERIKTDVDTLTNWILHPNNKDITQHVPDVLKNSVIPFLSSIDFTSKRQLKGGEATKADQEFVKQLKSMKAALKQNIDTYGLYSGYTDLPEDFMDNLQRFIDTTQALVEKNSGEFIINKMTAEELNELSKVVRTLKKYITQFNRFHYNSMYQYVYQAGDNSIQFMGELDDAGPLTGGVSNFLFWQQIRPAYAFERFGQGGKAIYDGFRRAHATLAFNTKVIEKFANETYTAKEVKAWENEIKQIELGEDIVKVPVAMLMSFYELSKQPDSLEHILGEGVRVATYTRNGKKISDKGHMLTEGDVKTMIATLEEIPRAKEVADALQKFMAETGGKWGNYVSMKRWGEELFGNPKYFPINSDGRHLQATADENPSAASLYALLNMSFTKQRKEGANNRIILYSIFDVFANHMASMAQYNAFALPMLDALKWFNYQQKSMPDENGKREVLASVRDQMARVYGTPDETRPGSGKKGYAENFVINILKAYNGTEAQGSPNDTVMLKMLHRFNVAQVSANLRVLIQQPTAIMRAGEIIDYRSIIKGMKLNPKAIKKNIEEMHKYSGIAVWKSLGFYDINISRGLTEIIKHDTGFVDKVNEIGMKGAETADLLTWAAIWSASKEEIIKKKGLKPTDNGFFEAVTELFEEVIYKTQVVDSVLTKNEYLRDKGYVSRLFGSFMGESTASISSVIHAVDNINMDRKRGMTRAQAWKKNGRAFVRMAYVYVLSNALTAAVQAIGDAWRDDDEYETFLEKWLEAFWGNFIDELNPIGKLPIFSEFVDVFKEILAAFGVDTYGNTQETTFGTLTNYAVKLAEIIADLVNEEEGYTWYAAVYKGLQLVSGATGLPMASATREIVSAWNNIVGSMAPSLKVKTYDSGDKNEIKYAYMDGYLTDEEAIDLLIEKGLVDSEDEAYWLVEGWEAGEGYSRYDAVLEAIRNGGDVKAAIAEMTAHGYTEEQINTKIKSEIGDWYKEGDISKQQATEMLTKYGDMDSDEIAALVNKWSSKVVTGIDYEDIKDEYLAGNITAARAIEMRVRYGGETKEKATEAVSKWRSEKETGIDYENLKEVFIDGEITEANARAMLVEYGGKTEEQALSTVRYWAFKRDYPNVYADDAWIDEYYEEVQSSGMSIDVFVDYRNQAKGITGEDKKARRMAVINSMPISSAQKDALYYAEGWAASKIYEAPWH